MKRKTKYERGHEAAKIMLRHYTFIHSWFEANPVREELLESLLYIAWRHGYDAARRDARKGGCGE